MRLPAVADWVNLYALAVNEENAAGGRAVTAPTNGAAGIIPAVLIITSAKIQGPPMMASSGSSLRGNWHALQENASISGASRVPRGGFGVACSMAAAGLTEAMGLT